MRIVLFGLLSPLLVGCFNPAMRVDNRTALEQQLTRTAIFRAVNELPIHRDVLEGSWRIEIVSPDSIDDGWTRTLLRERLVSLGADISTDTSEELAVVEAVVLFAGSDMDSFVLGIPIPGSLGTKSVSLYHENYERGRARIRLNFWTRDGELLAQTPAVPAEAHYGSVFFFTFIGAFSYTDLEGVETYGRFAEKSLDTWGEVQPYGEQIEPATSDAWIAPGEAPRK